MIFFIFCRVPNLVLNKNHSTLLQAAPKQMSYPACGNLNYKPCILSDIYRVRAINPEGFLRATMALFVVFSC